MFKVQLADGGEHVGTAPKQYCWKKDGKHPTEADLSTGIEGLVAARVLDEPNGVVLVSVPDGEVVKVDRNQIPQPSTEERSGHVPLRS